MKGIILEYKKNGVQVMDKDGYFRFVKGFTDCQIGTEIEIPQKSQAKEASARSRPVFYRRPALVSFGMVCVCLICILAARWNVPSYYVYVDAVEDIELTFNSLNIVISSVGFNSEGVALLERENFIGHGLKAVERSYQAMQETGFHTSGKDGHEFLEITVCAKSKDKANAISRDFEKSLMDRIQVATNFDHCDLVKREDAIGFGATPCKLLLAEKLVRIKPDQGTLEEIMELPMDDIHMYVNRLDSYNWD
ncbi:MAG: hypothetical protein FWF85_06395 [Clostridiales bacterium]|nr:hypothetical protein [Clostridiales bacterium]